MSEEKSSHYKSRVTSIHVGRVFNLGNYENERVEITVAVGSEDDPGRVLCTMESILGNLRAKHGVDSYYLRRSRDVLAKPEAELTDDEREELPKHRERVAKVEAAKARRAAAREALSTLNFTSEHIDHKDKWDDDDYYDEY